MSTITWPNGQILTSTALTPQAMETIFQNLTLNMLGNATPTSPTDALYQTVRIGWQSAGQPAMTATQDVVFLTAKVLPEHEYGQIRDTNYTGTGASLSAEIVYTRVWEVRWSIYGPNCFDNARIIKDALISGEWTRYILAGSNLYLSPENNEPNYVPEASPIRGQWWQRIDYVLHFNEEVDETLSTDYVESVQIDIYDATGEVAEIPVPA